MHAYAHGERQIHWRDTVAGKVVLPALSITAHIAKQAKNERKTCLKDCP